jgi:uncharacterized protein YkwD
MKPSRYLLFTMILLVAALVPASASSAATAVKLNTREHQLLVLINATRARHHLALVHVRAPLVVAARQHSREMIRRDYCSHNSASGASFAVRIARLGYWRSGYSYWSVGEIIGWGKGTSGTPLSIVRAWMKSPMHRAVILNKTWRDVGMGQASGTLCGRHGVLMYTVDFGRRIH